MHPSWNTTVGLSLPVVASLQPSSTHTHPHDAPLPPTQAIPQCPPILPTLLLMSPGFNASHQAHHLFNLLRFWGHGFYASLCMCSDVVRNFSDRLQQPVTLDTATTWIQGHLSSALPDHQLVICLTDAEGKQGPLIGGIGVFTRSDVEVRAMLMDTLPIGTCSTYVTHSYPSQRSHTWMHVLLPVQLLPGLNPVLVGGAVVEDPGPCRGALQGVPGAARL